MYVFLQTIAAGIFISFTGSLPFGNLNVTAMHVAAHEGVRKAVWFALGVACMEIIYLRVTLAAVNWVSAHHNLFAALQWLTIVFLLVLAVAGFFAARKKNDGKNVLIQNNVPRFWLGMAMSAVNPLQFPFWAGWAIALLSMHYLEATRLSYNVFALSAGAGTFIALMLFIGLGYKFSWWMQVNNRKIQFAMGVLFGVLAVYQLVIIW